MYMYMYKGSLLGHYCHTEEHVSVRVVCFANLASHTKKY